MTFDWFKIFNRNDFLALNLPSMTYEFFLEGYGQKSFLVTQGVGLNVSHEDKFLPVRFADKNPWIDSGVAVYEDANNDVWFGFQVTT